MQHRSLDQAPAGSPVPSPRLVFRRIREEKLPPLLFVERLRELSKQLPTLVEKTQKNYRKRICSFLFFVRKKSISSRLVWFSGRIIGLPHTVDTNRIKNRTPRVRKNRFLFFVRKKSISPRLVWFRGPVPVDANVTAGEIHTSKSKGR